MKLSVDNSIQRLVLSISMAVFNVLLFARPPTAIRFRRLASNMKTIGYSG